MRRTFQAMRIAAVVLMAAPHAYAVCAGLTTGTNYAAGESPRSVAVADFNGDGHQDLVFANYTANALTTVLGDSRGGFVPGFTTLFGMISQPTHLVVGEFNGDSHPDVVVTHLTGSEIGSGIFIMLSFGDGRFAAPIHYAVSGVPQAVGVADFNHDGNLDVAVANYLSAQPGEISVLLANPDKSLGTAVDYEIGNSPNALVVGDVNGDGDADIAVANSGSSTVSILIGDGTGSFGAPATYGVGSDPEAIVIGDLNADGKNDLIVGNVVSENVSVLIGVGGGVFAPAVNTDAGAPLRSVGVGDFNGDGALDVAAITDAGGGKALLIHPGNGDGTIAPPLVFDTPGSQPPFALATADFDTDGRPDLVTANVGNNTATVFLNESVCDRNCGVYEAGSTHTVRAAPVAVVAADFNSDGKGDLAGVNSGADNVSVLLGIGDGTFAADQTYGVGIVPVALAAGDFNIDGRMDLAVANNGSDNLSIILGNGDGSFAAPVHYAAGTAPTGVVAADFNRDGKMDLALSNADSNDLSLFFGDGTGAFAPAVPFGVVASASAIDVGDFNRDRNADLAIASAASGLLALYFGVGDGTFVGPATVAVGDTPVALAIGDLDKNGKADLVSVNSASNDVSVVLGNGGSSFMPAVHYPVGTQPRSVIISDFDDDGELDLGVVNEGSNSLSILGGAGDGTFALVDALPGAGPTDLVAEDFNRDGRRDLAVVNGVSADVAIFLNTCLPADLEIAKSHAGNFRKGQVGATYVITVANVGQGEATTPVTVNDTLPAGLTATAIAGEGWSCNLASLSCARTDGLAGQSSYPPITLTVDVAFDAPETVTNHAEVVAAGDIDTANNAVDDMTVIEPVPDLVIMLTHDGNFAQGQFGRTYTLTVRNDGEAPTSDVVEVSDTLPSGLTATAMAGLGWSCSLGTLTCTRNTVLAPGFTYPEITLTVDVSESAPAFLTNAASVSGGGQTFFANDGASDPTIVITRPVNVNASAISSSQVAITWDPVAGATRYQVLRSSNNAPAVVVGLPISNSFSDVSLSPATTYVYWVRAVDESNLGPVSVVDVATTILFTDDPLLSTITAIRVVHFTELRTAVNAMRAAAGLPPATFSNEIVRGGTVRLNDLVEMRVGLAEARAAIGLEALTFTDPGLAAGGIIKAVHIRELRAGVD